MWKEPSRFFVLKCGFENTGLHLHTLFLHRHCMRKVSFMCKIGPSRMGMSILRKLAWKGTLEVRADSDARILFNTGDRISFLSTQNGQTIQYGAHPILPFPGGCGRIPADLTPRCQGRGSLDGRHIEWSVQFEPRGSWNKLPVWTRILALEPALLAAHPSKPPFSIFS